jgi:hypothetical protein
VTKKVDARKFTWTYVHDYLSRPQSVIHPATNAGTLLEWFVYPDDGKGNITQYICGELTAAGAIGTLRRISVAKYDWGANLLERTQAYGFSSAATADAAKWVYDRGPYGHLQSITYTPQAKHTIAFAETYKLDNWYRIKSVTFGNATTDYTLGLGDEILNVTTPPHDGNQRAKWTFTYDDHLRDRTTTDPYQTVIKDTRYHDAGASAQATREHFGYTPKTDIASAKLQRSGAPAFISLRTTTFNSIGAPITDSARPLARAVLLRCARPADRP